MGLDPALIGFRPLNSDDLPVLHQWFALPHVAQWYRDEAHLPYEGVVATYTPGIEGAEPIDRFLITHDGHPIGLIQTYRMVDYPPHGETRDIDEGMAGVDMFIGDPAYVHQGLGSAILRHFLRTIVFGIGQATSCDIEPEIANTAARRCYEKAGFHNVTTGQLTPDDPPVCRMRIERAAVVGYGDQQR